MQPGYIRGRHHCNVLYGPAYRFPHKRPLRRRIYPESEGVLLDSTVLLNCTLAPVPQSRG